jgi:hypothetical protein
MVGPRLAREALAHEVLDPVLEGVPDRVELVEIDELGEKLLRIHAGTWQEELPGMEPGPAPAAGDAPGGIPDELWEAALQHVERCRAGGKGLDAKGLSMCLFGDRKGPHVERAEEIVEALAGRGHIVRDESDEAKARWLPAEQVRSLILAQEAGQ